MESHTLAINVVHFNNWFFSFYKIVKEKEIYDDCDLWIKNKRISSIITYVKPINKFTF